MDIEWYNGFARQYHFDISNYIYYWW